MCSFIPSFLPSFLACFLHSAVVFCFFFPFYVVKFIFCLLVECLCCVLYLYVFFKGFLYKKKKREKKEERKSSNSYFCLAVGYEVWLWAQIILTPGCQWVT